jgi:HSP20 family protein
MTTLEKYERPSLSDVVWSTWPFSAAALKFPFGHVMAMRVEEYVDGDDLVVKAELPGLDPDKDVEVTVDDGLLTIAAERRDETVEGEAGKPGYRSEFRYGSFRRVLPLRQGVRESDVTATYADGILVVRMPGGAEPAKPSRVPVTRS